MKNWLRVGKYFRADSALIGVAALLMLLGIGAGLLKPWPLALVVDCLLGQKPLPGWLASRTVGWDKSLLLGLLGAAVLLAYVLQAILSAAQSYLLIRIGLRGLARVRVAVFHWLQRLSLRFHQGSRQGDVIYRASWDTYAFQTLFQHGLFSFLAASLSLVLMVIVMWQLNGSLTLVALGTIPLLLGAMKFFGRRMSARSLTAHQTDGQVTSLVQQSIAALPLTQSYTQEEREERRFAAQAAKALRERMSQHGWEVLYLAVIAVIFGCGVAGIAWAGARQVWDGRLTVGELLVFLAYLTQFYEPLNQLSHVGTTVSDAGAGTQRVFEILDAVPEVQEAPDARPLARVEGVVELDHVSFGYSQDRLVLKDVSLRLAAGECVALVGPSGVGKTTLIHLLPRFFDPNQGSVRLDGHDLRSLRLRDLRAHVALVMQEPLLLPATIAENIAFGRPDASPDQIANAARAAQADGFIRNLPQQYDTLVGEGATRLSAGEKQRLNLARAFLKDAPVLVLDEPTSALDGESEGLVMASLHELMRGRTTLIVAHRLTTIRRANRILVLEQGRITETGTPAELLRAGGYLARAGGYLARAGEQAKVAE